MAGELNEADGRDDAGMARSRVGRRTMIKSAAAVGVGALAWSAPRIETLGFAPAGAAGTPCFIESIEKKNLNLGSNAECPDGSRPCCTNKSFNDASSNPDFYVFDNPTTGCTQLKVQLIASNCDTTLTNPSITQFALVITQSSGETCGTCTVIGATYSRDGSPNKPVERILGETLNCSSGDGVTFKSRFNSCADAANSSQLGAIITCGPPDAPLCEI